MDRDKQRLSGLSDVLSVKNLKHAWKDTVRHGLRRQDILDLHDYLDVHRNISDFCDSIRSDVLSENYITKEPEVVGKEKSKGICRRIVIPSAEDSILLQAIVDHIQSRILDKEPTDSAYYSRSHAPPKTFRDVDESFPSAWWNLWPEYQERIWGFTDTFKYVVFTDVSKYFDYIPLKKLRGRVSSLGEFREEVMDFLFYMLEQFVWQPEYVSYHGVGLPQINFDAPRLLAHCYLYDIDKYIENKTNNNFARWMDDINFGVDSIGKGKRMLKNIDLKLGGKGLRLNSAKSSILSPSDALRILRAKDNKKINTIENRLDQDLYGDLDKWIEYSKRRFREFYANDRSGRWGKVLKRFFTIFKKFDDDFLEDYVFDIIRDYPGIRNSIFRYYRSIGYSARRFEQIKTFVRGDHCIGDVSLFKSLYLISEWSIPYNSPYRSESINIINDLWDNNRKRSVSLIAGGVRVIGKYGTHQDLWDFVSKTEPIWQSSEWAARQVAAITPFLDARPTESITKNIRSNGLLEGLRVITHLDELRERESLDMQLKQYLTNESKYYPLEKVIISYNHLTGFLNSRQTKQLRTDVLELLDDSMNEVIIRNA